jgi:hypothetical protein
MVRNQGHTKSPLTDAADLARHLTGATAKLDSALGSGNDLVKSSEGAEIASAVDNVVAIADARLPLRGRSLWPLAPARRPQHYFRKDIGPIVLE